MQTSLVRYFRVVSSAEPLTDLEPPVLTSRMDRRKARTRGALIAAAQRLIAEGRTDASIQQITDAADVGFGSFYNHFTDKRELFEQATLDVLRQAGELLQNLTRDLEDPAQVFSVGLRIAGRMIRIYPELARVALQAGTRYLVVDEGLVYFGRRDFEAAVQAGRFELEDTTVALATAGGAVLGLLALLDTDPGLDAEVLSDRLAERVLRGLGLNKEEAAELVSRPLPDLSALPRRRS
jgi:AcrR family transcriptional regulator